MKFKCKQCGSADVDMVPDGNLVFVHEVDVRHFPPDLSDAELDDVEAEAIKNFGAALKSHKDRTKRERDQRVKGRK